MSCEIHNALTQAWSEANKRFSDAVNAMTGDQIGTLSRAEYMVLRGDAEKARVASENAGLVVETHRHEHGC